MVFFRKRLHRAVSRRRENHRRQNRLHLLHVPRKVGRMFRVIAGVGDDSIRKIPREVVLEMHHRVDKTVEKTLRQMQIAMVRQNGRLPEETPSERDAGRVELRKMELHHIMRRDQPRDLPSEQRHDDSLAQPKRDGRAEDADSVPHLLARRGGVEMGGEYRHLMPARGERLREAFRVNGQAGSVRTVIGEDGENLHANDSRFS